jgi:hypothetical protein
MESRNLQLMLEKSFLLFEEIGEDKIEEIARLVSKKNVEGGEDVERAWKILESLVRVSLRYIHEKRQPVLVNEAMQYKEPDFFSQIDLHRYANLYRLDLSAE